MNIVAKPEPPHGGHHWERVVHGMIVTHAPVDDTSEVKSHVLIYNIYAPVDDTSEVKSYVRFIYIIYILSLIHI